MKTIFYAIICTLLCVIYCPIYIIILSYINWFHKNKETIIPFTKLYANLFFVASPWWEVKINGLENIEQGKTYIIMANHQSMLDIPLIGKLHKKIMFVAKQEVLNIPIVNFIVLARKDILIKRGALSDSKRMLKRCRKELKQGVSIIIFPEGTRSKDEKIGQFKEGAFVVAKLGNSDILPIVIDGAYEVTHNKKWGLKFPAEITMNIMTPISFNQIREMELKDLKETIYNKMVSYHQTIKPELYNQQ